ncbi:MAG: DUF1579 family protein [Candidatus Korobacteraceae bacterium]
MKTILRGTILGALAAGLSLTLIAQDAGMSAKPAAKTAQPMAMPVPQPAPEMIKLIKMMGGNWTVTEKENPGPMFPNGGTGKGTATLTPGPGGLSLMEKYHSSGAMGPSFNGVGTFWWDPKAQVFRGLWCDNLTPNGCDASGTTKWDGDKLVGTMTSDMNGQKMVTQFVYSDWKPTSFVMTMSTGADAKSLKPAVIITYSKAPMAKVVEKMPQ